MKKKELLGLFKITNSQYLDLVRKDKNNYKKILKENTGSGFKEEYSFKDLILFKIAVDLLNANINRTVILKIRELIIETKDLPIFCENTRILSEYIIYMYFSNNRIVLKLKVDNIFQYNSDKEEIIDSSLLLLINLNKVNTFLRKNIN